jgi:hypothetical protein
MAWGEFPSPSTPGQKSISGKPAPFRGLAPWGRERSLPRFDGPWRRRWFGLAFNLSAALLITAGAVFFAGTRKTALEAFDAGTGAVYGRWAVKEGTEFFVEFIHSVNQSPVRDVYQVRARRIAPVAAVFSSFGAGMRADLEAGQTLSRDGEALRITGFTASYGELTYIVGTVSDHILGINNERISLRELCGKNAHITLRIR